MVRASDVEQLENAILVALPAEARAAIAEHLERVHLPSKQTVHWPGEPVTHVYFPIDGIVSLVVVMSDGTTVEFGVVGREGLVGLPAVLGGLTMPSQAFSQIAGDAWRLPTGTLQELVHEFPALGSLVFRYAQGLLSQAAQSVACNRVHTAEQRCARWLLMCHDRIAGDRLNVTHEFVAQMLGVRRATVSEVIQRLEAAGALANGRGRITILDRRTLETAACECHDVVERELARLLAI